jgi:hypothetical protein
MSGPQTSFSDWLGRANPTIPDGCIERTKRPSVFETARNYSARFARDGKLFVRPVNCVTSGAAKNVRATPNLNVTGSIENAHIHRNRHRGRHWPDLGGHCDVWVASREQRGNVSHDIFVRRNGGAG